MILIPLELFPEPTDARYSMFNTGGVELEVGEFLYGLVRMIKPKRILETGTHQGVSCAYMALGLSENANSGTITTIEIEPKHFKATEELISALGVTEQVDQVLGSVDTYVPNKDERFDLIFLDTEPNLRFAEFIRFFPYLNPGGIICIHDLGPQLGQTNVSVNDMLNWPFGTIPEEINNMIKDHEFQSFHFNTPRGFFVAQKSSPEFYSTKCLNIG